MDSRCALGLVTNSRCELGLGVTPPGVLAGVNDESYHQTATLTLLQRLPINEINSAGPYLGTMGCDSCTSMLNLGHNHFSEPPN